LVTGWPRGENRDDFVADDSLPFGVLQGTTTASSVGQMEKLYVACELGPQTSRIMLGALQDNTLKLGELHRFETPATRDKKGVQWNVPEIFQQILVGLANLGRQEVTLQSISCTSWTGDYFLFDREDTLLSPVYHFLNPRTEAGREQVLKRLSTKTVYAATGIPDQPSSTLYQLGAETSKRLKQTRTLLPVADAFNHLLGGDAVAEMSLASATQLYSPATKTWSDELARALDLNQAILPQLVLAGTSVGGLREDIAKQTKLEDTRIIASCSSHLAASLAMLPLNRNKEWGFVWLGEEGMVGTQIAEPILTEGAAALGYFNETAFGGLTNFTRPAVGLAILEACKQSWIQRDREINDEVLLHLATGATAFEAFIDVTDPRFENPADMPEKIQAFCRETDQEIPRKPGEIVRCVLESLALHYRKLFYETELLTGSRFNRMYLYGAEENYLLNHFVVDALQLPGIVVSPNAATIGNIIVQALALGHLSSPEAAQEVLRNSYKIQAIIPHQGNWQTATERMEKVVADAAEAV